MVVAGSLEAKVTFLAGWERTVGGSCDAQAVLISLNAPLGLVVVDRIAARVEGRRGLEGVRPSGKLL